MSFRRERELLGKGIRLIVEGAWSPAAQQEAAKGGFDILELQRGRQKDFSFLVPLASRIPRLWINCESDSSQGLEQLGELPSLTLSFPLRRPFDLRSLTGLQDLRIDAWQPWYADTLFAHPGLKSLHIEGYDGHDCSRIAALPSLESLGLARGPLARLAPLRTCEALRSLSVTHLRSLKDITELPHLLALQALTLGEALPGVDDLTSVFGCAGLKSLTIVGTKAEVAHTAWLRGFRCLRSLRLQSGVKELDWSDLLSSPVLDKLAIVSSTPLETSETEIRALAKAAGHNVREFVRFGTKKRPAWLLELSH